MPSLLTSGCVRIQVLNCLAEAQKSLNISPIVLGILTTNLRALLYLCLNLDISAFEDVHVRRVAQLDAALRYFSRGVWDEGYHVDRATCY
jgi:hypothetical protein